MTVSVRELKLGDSGVGEFLSLPKSIYVHDPNYVQQASGSVSAQLARPVFQDRQALFLAVDGGRAVARAVARVNPSLVDEQGAPLGLVGFFEAMDHPEGVDAVLKSAKARLHEMGAQRVIGPIDGDTWHKYRFNTGPYDERPFLMEPYNPAYYPSLWEASGFKPLESYYSQKIDSPPELAQSLDRIYRRALDSGYKLRRIDMTRYEEELAIIHTISCEIFAENFLYTDISLSDFIDLYASAKSIIDPDLVWFGETPGGEPVGFVFAVPDYFVAVKAMQGKSNLLAKARFLMRKHHADTFNLKTIGVPAAHRRSGIGGALMCHAHRMAMEKGYKRANHCLIKEGNPSGNMDRGKGHVMRRYTLYEYAE